MHCLPEFRKWICDVAAMLGFRTSSSCLKTHFPHLAETGTTIGSVAEAFWFRRSSIDAAFRLLDLFAGKAHVLPHNGESMV